MTDDDVVRAFAQLDDDAKNLVRLMVNRLLASAKAPAPMLSPPLCPHQSVDSSPEGMNHPTMSNEGDTQ
ncbi:hypothetical protein ACEUZ9_000132 [Paracoccus litorisediminis]|uniref:hypothetical protein n=1 Tax=Paracoccus litorisediminis TaxID=2006130 RepID=UPI00372E485B